MKKLVLVALTILISQTAMSQWRSLDFFATVFDITFTPQGTGYAAAGYSVLKSTDGGTQWIPCYETTSQDDLVLSLCFPEENTGYASCMQGKILKTTDAGSTWTVINTGTTENLWSVFFINAATGYAAGENGVIVKTTDGGNTWSSKTTPNGTIRDLYFKNENYGLAAPTAGPILQTQDGGVHWLSIVTGVTNLYSINFPTENTGYMCGWEDQLQPVILKSTDGGNKWNKLNVSIGFALTGIFFTDENTGYAAGLNTILKTTDGGATWGPQAVPLAQQFNCIYFKDNNHGFIGGAASIYVTDNGGGPIGINEKERSEFSISPNPAKDFIKISSTEISGVTAVQITDVTGKTVKTANPDVPGTIDVSDLGSGTYFIFINSGKKVSAGKFLKN